MESSRREFIKNGLYGVLAMLGGAYLFSTLTVLSPFRREERRLHFFTLLPEDALPRQGVKKAELDYKIGDSERKARIFVVASGGEMTIFSAVCSHLGCLVNYHKETREFICPCHGGKYDLSGKNISGPPPAPLTKLPHRIENGMVLVGIKI